MNFIQKCDYYVRQIENYCGFDPLNYWYEYTSWLEKNANNVKENKEILEAIFCKCLSIFEKVETYKQDLRLIKIFIKYVSFQENPVDYLQLMIDNGFGTKVANLYVFWATCHELENNFDAAQNIYRLAINNDAIPNDIITFAQNEFRTGFNMRHTDDREIFFNRKFRKYSSFHDDTTNSIQPNGMLTNNCIPYLNYETETPPSALNQSIVQTIMDSARKAKGTRKSNLIKIVHRLNFEDNQIFPIPLIGPNLYEKGIQLPRKFVSKNLPQRFAQIDHFVDSQNNLVKDNVLKIPQYNKIMLIPNQTISYSPEELRAYCWFAKKKIKNNFTHEMDSIWKNDFSVSFRRSFCLVERNLPQDEKKFDFYEPENETSTGKCKFAIRIDGIYPKNSEKEFSIDELKWKKRTNGMAVEVKKSTSIFKIINQMKKTQTDDNNKICSKDEQENVNPKIEVEPQALPPPQKLAIREEFAVPATVNAKASRKSSIDYPELNETCTTQSFGMFLKPQVVSTPKDDKFHSMPPNRKKFTRLSHLTSQADLSADASLLEFEKIEQETESLKEKPIQFNIYQDQTIDLKALEAKKAESHEKHPIPVTVNDENNENIDKNEMTICNMVNESITENDDVVKCKQNDSREDHKYTEEISGEKSVRKSNSMEYSIRMNSYERKIVIKNPEKVIDFTMNCPVYTDEDEEEAYEPGKSIYVSRPEVIFDEKKHADWAEVTLFLLDECKENNYAQNVVDLNETRQNINTQLIDLMNLSPFDVKLKNGLLQSVSFEDKLSKFDKTICTMQKIVQPLKPKIKFSIGERSFLIQKMIGSGAFGNVFVGICNKTNEKYAFKQEKPPNIWEYYICWQTHKRIENKRVRDGCMRIENALIGNNATIFVSKYSQCGTLLDVCNKFRKCTGKNLNEYIVMILSKQMLTMIHELHKAKIIHGDIKPDNFLLMEKLSENDCDNIVLQLIDFGQSIDMKLFPSNQVFYSKLKTENFICTEMLDGRPWTYQHDLYCIAATIYTLVCGKYMSVKKMGSKYTTTMPRYCKRDFWMPIFDVLINIDDSKSLPNLLEISDNLDKEIGKLQKEELSKQIVTFNKSLLK